VRTIKNSDLQHALIDRVVPNCDDNSVSASAVGGAEFDAILTLCYVSVQFVYRLARRRESGYGIRGTHYLPELLASVQLLPRGTHTNNEE
jgi:hypothetical protein